MSIDGICIGNDYQVLYNILPTQGTTQGLDLCESSTPMLDVYIHVNTHAGNKNSSMNFNQESVKIILAIVSILPYL